MYYNLTENIYWGDWKSVYQLKDIVGAVVCVAWNQEMIDGGYSPLVLPYSIPYFKLAERDRAFPSDSYFKTLYLVFKALKGRHFPVLVHCYMGQHRSPIIAVMAAIAFSDKLSFELDAYYEQLLKFVDVTLPDFERTRKYNYSVVAQIWIKGNILSVEGRVGN